MSNPEFNDPLLDLLKSDPSESKANPVEVDETPRIYVASLSDYNNGFLHGAWIDATQDVDEVWAEINQMLADSPWTKLHGEPAEEHAIHDTENFAGVPIGECEAIERVVEIAQALANCDEPEAMAAFLANDDEDPSGFEEAFRGKFDSLTAYAESQAEDLGLGGLDPKQLEGIWSFIDWEHVAHEMRVGGDVWTARSSDSGVFVFLNL